MRKRKKDRFLTTLIWIAVGIFVVGALTLLTLWLIVPRGEHELTEISETEREGSPVERCSGFLVGTRGEYRVAMLRSPEILGAPEPLEER